MKLALTRTATRKEDPEVPLLQRIRSLELPALEKMLHIVQVTDTSQHQLFGADCVNQAFMVELSCLGQETRAMDIRPMEICPFV